LDGRGRLLMCEKIRSMEAASVIHEMMGIPAQ
jgi:hypothetical protein